MNIVEINQTVIQVDLNETPIDIEVISSPIEVSLLTTINPLKGDQGEPGAQGEQGEPGLDGKSAYELAVENGYIGDLNSWLLSLKQPRFEQSLTPASNTFIINHNLGYSPSVVRVIDQLGYELLVSIVELSLNTIRIESTTLFSGKVIIS